MRPNNDSYSLRVLIAELDVPYEKKTIKPVQVGGVAGGVKYITHQMFLKFATDDPKLQLYGGWRSNMRSHIVQGRNSQPRQRVMYVFRDNMWKNLKYFQELNSLNALISTNVPNLHFPLMALVNAYGYRVIAVSKLPINSSTLIYVFGLADFSNLSRLLGLC